MKRPLLPFAGLAGLLAVLSGPPPAQAAGTLTISGIIFYDRNGNGVRDPGEPGVPGIRVRYGPGPQDTVTEASGAYRLTGLPRTGKILVETGWLRTQCPPADDVTRISCPPGPGRDNAFTVEKQFVTYPLAGAHSTADANAGLQPDQPGPGLTPPEPGTIAPANRVDIAARLSWTGGTCVGGALNICREGDKFRLAAQVYNQGTTALTGIRAKIFVPPGDCLTHVRMVAPATAPGIAGVRVTPFSCVSREVGVEFPGTLVPAGAARVLLGGRTVAGPGTPGCHLGAIDRRTCSIAEPQGRGWIFGITHIDQAGDPDSVFCDLHRPGNCPTGVHDKRRAPDEIDPAGHNVDAALGGSAAGNIKAHIQLLGGTARRDSTVGLRIWLSDTGPGVANQIPPGATMVLHLPAGSSVRSVPPSHYLAYCGVGGHARPRVTCHYRGPLSPGVAAIAADVYVQVPSVRSYHPYLCAFPPAGVTETVPAQTCDGRKTTSDNDADLHLTLG